MIRLKSKREIEIIQKAAVILKEAFERLKPAVRAGVRTLELDRIAEKTIEEGGGKSAFKDYRGYPRTLCVSVNEEVVHGIPSDRKLKAGDLVSLDLGVLYQGYYADAARSWMVDGVGSGEARKLIETAREAFFAGIDAVKEPGRRVGDLSSAVQKYVEKRGFGIVREYVGHGIGQMLHEDPQVPNFGKPGQGPRIEPGLVLAIEPMLTAGHYAVETLADGWTVVTKDRRLASHYEDTVAFTDEGPVNLTGPEKN